MPRETVKIENPPIGFADTTSLFRARKYEHRGQAHFTGPRTIRFNDTPLQAAIVKESEEQLHSRITGAWYDRVEGNFLADVRSGMNGRRVNVLPVIDPDKMTRQEKSSRDWSYSSSVFHRQRQNEHNNMEVEFL